MWPLALPATMGRFAPFHKVSRSQTVYAEVVRFQCGHHLVVGKGLEARAGIQWMFLTLTEDTIGSGVGSVCCKRCDGIVALGASFRSVRLASLPIRLWSFGCLGTEIDEIQ